MSESASVSPKILRIGTRGSALALIQARFLASTLQNHFSGLQTEIIPIRAAGDHDPADKNEKPLYSEGGKGLFTKELETALLDGRVDLAVHSMKDVPSVLEKDFIIAAALPREDARDVFVSSIAAVPEELPEGAVIGTTSPRRRAQIMHLWPHLKVVPFRGNVDTRLRKLADGQVQGTFLAYAGLKRLGREDAARCFMDTDRMLPCGGQGIIGIEILKNNTTLAGMLGSINDASSFAALEAERAMLRVLGGSCDTPIGAFAHLEAGELVLEGMVAHPDGKALWQAKDKAAASMATALGEGVGKKLLAQVPPGILPE